jgi:hypothetical protein
MDPRARSEGGDGRALACNSGYLYHYAFAMIIRPRRARRLLLARG